MSQQQSNNVGQALWESFQTWLLLLITALIAFWLLSKWLTKMFFDLVLNPLTDGALRRHDGLAVMISAGLWTGVFMGLYGWFIYPELTLSTPQEKIQALWVFTGLGLVWGLSIGGMILAEWWSEQSLALEPVFEPSQRLGQPVKIVSAPSIDGQRLLPSKEELKQDLTEIPYRQNGRSEPQPMGA